MKRTAFDCVSRRAFLPMAAAAAAAPLAGCGEPRSVLKVFNWSDYIDADLIAQFERQNGCTVVYDNYSSDSELETRLATGAGRYDVVFPSDRALAALLAKRLLQPIDHSSLPNMRHLDRQYLDRFDRGNRFSVPYFTGMLAVGVRTDFVRIDVTGLAPLFDPENRGRITMLDDMENVVAAALCHLDLPLNSVEAEHLLAAQRLLREQKPLVQAYTSDAYRERLISSQAWASLGWSGDLLQADRELEGEAEVGGQRSEVGGPPAAARVRVILPSQGTMLWMDSMVIPQGAPDVALAHAFIDYLLEPQVAAANAQSVNYATPNAAARALLPADVLASEGIYPPREYLDRCTWLEDRGQEIEKIERLWRAVRT